MRGRKTAVYLMTAFLVMVVAITELYMKKQEEFNLSVYVTSKDNRETINAWFHDGCYYVFLPSYTDPDQAKLVTNVLFPVWIDGERVESATVCGAFPFNKALPITYNAWGEIREEKIYFCQSGNVPTLYIDTASGGMDYIHEDQNHTESGDLRLYNPEGERDCHAQIQTINGRGNSTWDRPKKPYSLKLAQGQDLLGMGSAKEWILLANFFDSTNMGNKMSYDFAASAGCAYTPECQWVDLYLNGNYAGLYLISERNEVEPQRINIPKESSFLISRELEIRSIGKNYASFTSDRGIFMRIHHSGIPEDKTQAIWQSVENAIYAPGGIDPATGKYWQDLIDLDSWVQQYLLWEVFMDWDAAGLSAFFYFDGNTDRVFAGPVWDMDLILSMYYSYPRNAIVAGRKYIRNPNQESLFYTMYQKEIFQQRVKELYQQVYRPLLVELAESGMDAYLAQSLTAGEINSIRWEKTHPSEDVHTMKQHLIERIAFLDDYWGAEEKYCYIDLLDTTVSSSWRRFAVRRGETADFLPTYSEPWVDCETGESFDPSAPVTGDRMIRLAESEEE